MGQSYDCPSASEATLKNMVNHSYEIHENLYDQNKAQLYNNDSYKSPRFIIKTTQS